ncbi:hypothetical protein ACFX13_015855 [Malus domestica]
MARGKKIVKYTETQATAHEKEVHVSGFATPQKGKRSPHALRCLVFSRHTLCLPPPLSAKRNSYLFQSITFHLRIYKISNFPQIPSKFLNFS